MRHEAKRGQASMADNEGSLHLAFFSKSNRIIEDDSVIRF